MNHFRLLDVIISLIIGTAAVFVVSFTTVSNNSTISRVQAFLIVVQRTHQAQHQNQHQLIQRYLKNMVVRGLVDVDVDVDTDVNIDYDENVNDETEEYEHDDLNTEQPIMFHSTQIKNHNDNQDDYNRDNYNEKLLRKKIWKQRLAEYKQQVLDPSYMVPSVRGNTIIAAQQYPQRCTTEIEATLMPGTHKHLGGAYDPTDGCIYGVPANARAVLCLYPTIKTTTSNVDDNDHVTNNEQSKTTTYSMKTIPLPSTIADCNYKWLRGIFAHGYLWAIPAWANCVLCVDVDAYWNRRPCNGPIVQLLPLPKDHIDSTPDTTMQWQWHGAGINHEKTAIYCIPSNAKYVLKVDLMTKVTSLIQINGYDPERYPNFSIDTTNKWYGGITGHDNCVYGIPYRTCAVLQINCTNDSATLVGPDYGNTKYNWHGGIQVHGKIYAHPSHANTVLVIDTNVNNSTTNDTYQQCTELPIHRAPYDTDACNTYKWLGGSIGLDGNIYCPACDISSILKIDVINNTCTTFGYTSTEKNKWQGGILGRDGCIYCIPASGIYVCRIATHPTTMGIEQPIQLLGPLSSHKDKWQGGHVGIDGCLYFIPENGYRVLKITPPKQPPCIVDGKLPEGDVLLELL